MRLLKLLTTIIAVGVVYVLFVLPGQVAEHIFIGWIADGIRNATGWELPRLETALRYISFLVPLLAACAAMYLYHRVYLPTVIRQYQPVREGTQRVEWRSGFVGLCLAVFIGGVIYAGYVDQFRPVIPGPTKYLELRHLPNQELRERAFTVAQKLRELSKEYAARQSEINSQYTKEKDEFDKRMEQYKTANAEYEKNKASCTTFPFSIVSGSSSSPSCVTLIPPVPPTEPSFPVVTVEPEWAANAEKVEEETAAVWEEIPHRFGG
jgi:hypothetical protein